MHKYYREPKTGEVFAYASDGSEDEYIKPGLVKMNAEEVRKHLNPPQAAPTREQIESMRLRAYADPLTGSDRLFAEAVRLQAINAPAEEIDAVKSAGVHRYEEIQAAYPWPPAR